MQEKLSQKNFNAEDAEIAEVRRGSQSEEIHPSSFPTEGETDILVRRAGRNARAPFRRPALRGILEAVHQKPLLSNPRPSTLDSQFDVQRSTFSPAQRRSLSA